MNTASAEPTTLVEAVAYFADEDMAVAYMAEKLWPEGAICPHCGSKSVGYVKSRRLWQCKDVECRKQFTVKIGTVMEDSPIPVGKWLVVMWLVANAKNSISSHEIGRAIGVTQKSAWFMIHRVHLAMQDEGDGKLMGQVEVDETFIGGSARNMHADRRKAVFGDKKTGTSGKAFVVGMLERAQSEKKHSRVRAEVVSDTKRKTLEPIVKENVETGSAVYTDANKSYCRLSDNFFHQFIDHAVTYAEGHVHTNGLENFWSLFKRCIKGTHVNIEPFHTFRYLDGEAFRFNNRKVNDGARFAKVAGGVSGKRLTYKKLTGKDDTTTVTVIEP